LDNGTASREPAEIARSLWKAWQARDKPATLEFLTEDVVFALFIPQEIVPFGGETTGKGATSDRLQTILDQFDTLAYEGTVTRTEGDTVYGKVAYRFRHKVSGEVIDGTMRQVLLVRNGRIAKLSEHHDVELIRAFMRLVAQSAADRAIPPADGHVQE
jgi:ketosteroid isomerase-like protein